MDYVCLDSAYRPHPLIGRLAADATARGVYEIEITNTANAHPISSRLLTNILPM